MKLNPPEGVTLLKYPINRTIQLNIFHQIQLQIFSENQDTPV